VESKTFERLVQDGKNLLTLVMQLKEKNKKLEFEKKTLIEQRGKEIAFLKVN
jgi:hypothetical protein